MQTGISTVNDGQMDEEIDKRGRTLGGWEGHYERYLTRGQQKDRNQKGQDSKDRTESVMGQ